MCPIMCVVVRGKQWKLILSHQVSLKTGTQIIRLGGKHSYLLSHLAGPHTLIFQKEQLTFD